MGSGKMMMFPFGKTSHLAGGSAPKTVTTTIGLYLPIVVTAVYAFLTIRFEETTILDFIRYAFAFFIGKQQHYEWEVGR
jgi:hypothetical protein